MHFLKTLLVGASAFALASAQLAFTQTPTTVEVGKQYTVTYSGGSGSVEIVLRKGDKNDLKTIATLSSGTSGGSFTWTPDPSLPNGSDYALQITSGSQTNYAGPITLTGSTSTGSITGTTTGTGSSASITASPSLSRNATSYSNSTVTATTGRNGTITTPSLTASTLTTTAAGGASRTSGSSGSGATTAPTGAAAALKSSPLALVLCAIAGFVYLN